MRSPSAEPLFRPLTVKRLTLPNRIVMAPMTRGFSPGGVPGPDVAAYYRRRAENGVGLIVTEGTWVAHPTAADNPNVPRFHGDDALAGWARVVAEVHDAGGLIMPQLWHVGMSRKPGSQPNPEVASIGPSGLARPGDSVLSPITDTPVELVKVAEPPTEAAIASVVAAYAQSAADAMRLGFDGIELHGAHGYLIDQFFWERTNKRTDRYGGDLVARTAFAVEVVEACRRATGPDFPIVLRFSQWKLQDYNAKLAATPHELARFLEPLVDAGVDVFHCSTRRFWQPEFEGSHLNLGGWTKKLTGLPTITVGSVGLDVEFLGGILEQRTVQHAGIDRLIRMIEQDEVDLVAIGRALLVDPAWAAKIRDGRTTELLPFTPEAFKTLA